MKNICLQMNRKIWISLLLALFISLPALAQKIAVQGTVVDETGEPLIGASVIQKGTTSGAATDFDGIFRLSVDPQSVLLVTYVGYQPQEVAVNGKTSLKVVMKEAGIKLDEVVAIGYGVVKKNDATGSVSTIKPSEVQAGLATSAQDLLVGQAPGVVVTSTAGPQGEGTIRIRGGSSLNASNDPLIVVDGVPMDNSGILGMKNPLSMIAPDNIENMTVLKDASATAIYGSRASNGVIIITTKKGKKGRPQVNFSANMYVNTARKTWDVLSADQFRALVKENFGEESSEYNNLGKANTDWQKEVLRTSVSHDYNLSVGGTAGILPYRVSASYTNNNGILKNSMMDRATVGFNLNPTFFGGLLKINANAKGYFVKATDDELTAVSDAIAMDPTSPVYTNYTMAAGAAATLYNGYTTYMGQGGSFNTNGTINPVATNRDKSKKSEIWRSNGNLQIDYALHFLPELHFNLNLGYDVSKSTKHEITAQNSPLAWNNAYKNGAATDFCEYQFNSNTLLDFYMNYNKEFDAIKSHIDVTAGYSWQRFHQDGWNNGTMITSKGYLAPTQNADGSYNLAIDEASADKIGTRYTVSALNFDKNNADGSYHYANHLQLLSFFGRLNYTLMDRYLFTFTMRGDATSRFHKDNRWGTFPAVALGWKISEESFMQGARDWMNELKLRLGWGVTGQQDIKVFYPYLAIYESSKQGSNYVNILQKDGTYITTLYPKGYDPKLKWEETTTWNAGLDFGFLNNRITASMEYYFRKTKDLLSYVTIPVGSNTTNMLNQNIGTLENQGVEFSITARPVVTKDFTWTVNYNVAYNRNKITKLNNDGSFVTTGAISGATGNNCQVQMVGYPAFSFRLYEQVYDASGNPIEGEYVDQDGNGKIDDGDLVVRHSKDPKVTMTFSSQFNWKNWDFSFSLRSSIGNYVYNNVRAQRSTISDINRYGMHNLVNSDFYFQGGKTTNSLYLSDYWLRNASFLRCDNITLGYTWNNITKENFRIRVYGAVQNPFVITKYNGLDPEVFGGIDKDVYPRPITCTLGVVATF